MKIRTNSIPIVDGKPFPVCEQAGFGPLRFGYHRCPGEQFTIKMFKDFLRKVWADEIEFQDLDMPDPERDPIGPGHLIPMTSAFPVRADMIVSDMPSGPPSPCKPLG